MPAGEDGDQELVDDVVLADDLACDLLAYLVVDRLQALQFGEVGLGGRGRRRGCNAQARISSGRSIDQRWNTGRNLKGSWRMMAAIAVP